MSITHHHCVIAICNDTAGVRRQRAGAQMGKNTLEQSPAMRYNTWRSIGLNMPNLMGRLESA